MKRGFAWFAMVAGLLLAAGCGSNPESTTVTNGGKSVNVTDNKGNSASLAGAVSEADLGLPFYAGSTEKSGGASMVVTDNGVKTATSDRTTKDDPDKVADFYKGKLKDVHVTPSNEGTTKMVVVNGTLDDGSEVAVTVAKEGSADTEITVSVKHAK